MSEPATTLPAHRDLALRRVPLPRWEPPYDDEREPDRPVEVALAHAVPLPLELPRLPAPRPRPPLRLVPQPPEGREGAPQPQPLTVDRRRQDEDEDDRLPRTPREQLPDPRVWAGRLVQVLVEVLAGERPAGQVMRHVSLAVYGDLVAVPPRSTRPTGVRGRGGPASAAQVTSLRLSEPDDGVAEVCAVTRRGDRYGALALRLEGQGGRWRCVALQVG